jgi:hypothetical protein
MSKQFHFVVAWDSERKRFYVDPVALDFKFTEGEIWNEDTEEWECREPGEDSLYEELEDRLAGVLYELGKVGEV